MHPKRCEHLGNLISRESYDLQGYNLCYLKNRTFSKTGEAKLRTLWGDSPIIEVSDNVNLSSIATV